MATDTASTAPHIVLALDLEMAQPSGHIIQIGAVIGDLLTGEILSEFNELVNPHEPISPYITTLTGISDNDIAQNGIELQAAYDKLVTFWAAPQDKYAKSARWYQVVTWGGGDMRCLREQVMAQNPEAAWPFGRREVDVKTIYQFRQLALGEKPQSGLSKSLNRLGLSFKGTKHNALDDAKNTFRAAHYLANEIQLGLSR